MNADDAAFCTKCGTTLKSSQPSQPDYGAYWRHRHYGREYRDYYYPRHRGWGALFAGVIIIIIGLTLLLSEVYGFNINWSAWWAIIVIVIGLWLIFVAVRVSLRHRPQQQPQP